MGPLVVLSIVADGTVLTAIREIELVSASVAIFSGPVGLVFEVFSRRPGTVGEFPTTWLWRRF